MSGNHIGGLKVATIMKTREADYYQRIGGLGGATPTMKLKGFAANRELASVVGAKGGKISKRTKKTEDKKGMPKQSSHFQSRSFRTAKPIQRTMLRRILLVFRKEKV